MNMYYTKLYVLLNHSQIIIVTIINCQLFKSIHLKIIKFNKFLIDKNK